MLNSGRLSHAFLLYGEKGLGKKTLAKYIAMRIMCEDKTSNQPCGNCFHCRNILNDTHPDVITAEHTGKTNAISADTVRKICNEAFIKPNYQHKIFLFLDADVMNSTAQNILLKSIEEPPEYAYYIFTANSRDDFLPTILSRVASIGVTECSDRECSLALSAMGYDESQITSAVECFHGNLGNCIDYLNQGELFTSVEIVKSFTNSLLHHDEYELLKVFTALKDLNLAKKTLSIMDRHIRDIIAVKIDCHTLSGCDFNGAKMLAERLSIQSCQKIHLLIYKALNTLDNKVGVNLNITLTALCADIITSI